VFEGVQQAAAAYACACSRCSRLACQLALQQIMTTCQAVQCTGCTARSGGCLGNNGCMFERRHSGECSGMGIYRKLSNTQCCLRHCTGAEVPLLPAAAVQPVIVAWPWSPAKCKSWRPGINCRAWCAYSCTAAVQYLCGHHPLPEALPQAL
jgi:hypothetical protein